MVCLSNVKQIYMGIALYCNDNADYFPLCAGAADGISIGPYPEDWLYWQANRNIDDSPIAKYLNASGEKLKKILRCPSQTPENRMALLGISAGQGPYLYSYGFSQAAGTNNTARWGGPLRTKRAQWRRPSEKILIGESHEAPCSAAWDPAAFSPRCHGQAISPQRGVLKGINASAAFFDGHVEGVDEDFYYLDLRQEDPAG
jgi:prepilin-type processing-associated H-X9-DG protein